MSRPKISPFLWFREGAEDAARFYVSLFEDSEMGDTMPGPDGGVLGVSFRIAGQEVQALNGGPDHGLTPAFSFLVRCEDQAEVDRLWDALTADGGEESMCGWLVDRFGLSWQIIPDRLMELLGDPDPARAGRATQAMLAMRKIDVAALEAAAAG
jgi:predicted 3-demethylubiquinone-9 3-methyltransferase (glyoxalase superfamily)